MKTYRVIFHLDEDSEEKINEVFNNLRNLIADLGQENVEVELLTNGKGVMAMRRENESNGLRIRNLARQGVKFAVCANSIRHLKIDPDELAPEAEIVPAGVSELVKKQSDGWAYIRP
jgi:intracellular sulfur oxidation DsrE/DsrF family protein